MDRRRLLLDGGFPKKPTDYEIIDTYTSPATFTAPGNGYFQIEVFGASGNGGKNYDDNMPGIDYEIYFHSGGGGGGGGYAASRIKLKKGDTVVLSPGGVGVASYARISSSIEEYSLLNVTSGANGGDAQSRGQNEPEYGYGGAGGVASGGNYLNKNGGNGGNGNTYLAGDFGDGYETSGSRAGGVGGAAGYPGGNVGGAGQEGRENTTPGAGKAGFIKVWMGIRIKT